MQPEARERLRHVIEAGETIVAATNGKSFDDYAGDKILKYAVEQHLPLLLIEVRELLAADPSSAQPA